MQNSTDPSQTSSSSADPSYGPGKLEQEVRLPPRQKRISLREQYDYQQRTSSTGFYNKVITDPTRLTAEEDFTRPSAYDNVVYFVVKRPAVAVPLFTASWGMVSMASTALVQNRELAVQALGRFGYFTVASKMCLLAGVVYHTLFAPKEFKLTQTSNTQQRI